MVGMTALLSDNEIEQALSGLTGWQRDGNAIRREASLPTFPTAITAVDRIAEAAEAAQHHPDIDIRYRTLTFVLSTHSEGGLTEKDFALAKEIDDIVGKLS